ncbi:hypothetical protein AMTRI_Chr06g197770 [Amborella trichopoda]
MEQGIKVIRWNKKKMKVPLMLWEEVKVHWPDMLGGYGSLSSYSYGMYIERKTQQQQMLWLKMQSRCVNCDIKIGPEFGGEIECK